MFLMSHRKPGNWVPEHQQPTHDPVLSHAPDVTNGRPGDIGDCGHALGDVRLRVRSFASVSASPAPCSTPEMLPLAIRHIAAARSLPNQKAVEVYFIVVKLRDNESQVLTRVQWMLMQSGVPA